MNLEDIPRVRLIHGPTPLEPLARLRERIGGPRLWIKRDDCTGLATGGNKSRKLEYLLAAAEAEGADRVLTFGALQSNHARQTAAACARRGLGCDLVLAPTVPRAVDGYERAGNLLLDDLLGAAVHRVPPGGDAMALAREILAGHAEAGRRCVLVPTGGSNAVGALGYVRCAAEIAADFRGRGLYPQAVVHASSSGGTQAGHVAGFALEGLATRVVGVNTWTRDVEGQRATIRTLAEEVLGRLAPGQGLDPGAVEIEDGQLGEGYGVPTTAMVEAVRLLARTEGVLLDPVYSGKGMAGLLAMIRRGAFDEDDDVVFVHTGGAAALGVYTSAFTAEG